MPVNDCKCTYLLKEAESGEGSDDVQVNHLHTVLSAQTLLGSIGVYTHTHTQIDREIEGLQ